MKAGLRTVARLDGALRRSAGLRGSSDRWDRQLLETMRGDVLADREIGPIHAPVAKWEQRLVFADAILL